MKKLRGYIFSRAFLGERVPQAVQNLVIRDYCQRIGAQFLLSASEYAMDDSHLILEHLLDELDSVDGLVPYSLFQLPADRESRLRALTRVIAAGKEMHFALEGFAVRSEAQIPRVDDMWRVKQALVDCPVSIDLAAYAGGTVFAG